MLRIMEQICRLGPLVIACIGAFASSAFAGNLETCLSGQYPILCKHHLLTPEQRRGADAAERRENARTCLSGQYPILCKHHLLTPEQRREADAAERRENARTCLSGQYPILCKHHLLTEGERREVDIMERGGVSNEQMQSGRYKDPAVSRQDPEPKVKPMPSIVQVQTYLSLLGYNPGPVDGLLGPATREAIKSFQRENNITPDGVVSDVLVAQLHPD